MIYELRIYTTKPGMIGEFVKLNTEVAWKLRGNKHGTLVGCWTSEIGQLNQFYHLWSYPSLAERATLRAGLAQMPDYRPQLAGLSLPVRLLVGEDDEKFRRLAAEMASLLPRATVTTVAAAGHNLILEAPQAVAAAIMEGIADGVCDD